MTDISIEHKATAEELRAMVRLLNDSDGRVLFDFLRRRLHALDVSSRKIPGDCGFINGRRTELAQLIELAESAKDGNANLPKREGVYPGPPALPKPLDVYPY